MPSSLCSYNLLPFTGSDSFQCMLYALSLSTSAYPPITDKVFLTSCDFRPTAEASSLLLKFKATKARRGRGKHDRQTKATKNKPSFQHATTKPHISKAQSSLTQYKDSDEELVKIDPHDPAFQQDLSDSEVEWPSLRDALQKPHTRTTKPVAAQSSKHRKAFARKCRKRQDSIDRDFIVPDVTHIDPDDSYVPSSSEDSDDDSSDSDCETRYREHDEWDL